MTPYEVPPNPAAGVFTRIPTFPNYANLISRVDVDDGGEEAAPVGKEALMSTEAGQGPRSDVPHPLIPHIFHLSTLLAGILAPFGWKYLRFLITRRVSDAI